MLFLLSLLNDVHIIREDTGQRFQAERTLMKVLAPSPVAIVKCQLGLARVGPTCMCWSTDEPIRLDCEISSIKPFTCMREGSTSTVILRHII